MALTIGEASAVNTLIHFITQDPNALGELPSSEKALEAANLLCAKAYKALMCGYHGDGDVAKVWPAEPAKS